MNYVHLVFLFLLKLKTNVYYSLKSLMFIILINERYPYNCICLCGTNDFDIEIYGLAEDGTFYILNIILKGDRIY